MNVMVYAIEALCLGIFIVVATLATTALQLPASPLHQAIGDPLIRRLLIGIIIGMTAIAIIYSPWGKRSGSHLNPSVTLTFWRLKKIRTIDIFVMAQHSVDWFITAEDLPDPNNRVTYKNGSIHLNYTENNPIAFDRLRSLDWCVEIDSRSERLCLTAGYRQRQRLWRSNFASFPLFSQKTIDRGCRSSKWDLSIWCRSHRFGIKYRLSDLRSGQSLCCGWCFFPI